MGRVKGKADNILESFGQDVVRLSQINVGSYRRATNSRGKSYRKRIDSSGALRNSIGYSLDMRGEDGRFIAGRVSFSMLDYGKYVDAGRKKGKGIPIKPLVAWIKKKPLKIRDLETGSFVKATESRINSLAFLISRKAKEKGIKPTNFFSDPFNEKYKELSTDLANAVGEDYANAVAQDIDNNLG